MDNEKQAKRVIKLVERLLTSSVRDSDQTLNDTMRKPKPGHEVVVSAVINDAPYVRRYGILVKSEYEPTPTQDDVEFRGPDWKPSTYLVHTLLGIDGKEYRWHNVILYRVPD